MPKIMQMRSLQMQLPKLEQCEPVYLSARVVKSHHVVRQARGLITYEQLFAECSIRFSKRILQRYAQRTNIFQVKVKGSQEFTLPSESCLFRSARRFDIPPSTTYPMHIDLGVSSSHRSCVVCES
ncbi:MAG: hypothetical protein EZS28_007614 [Streblomastix strix]|uniref:Uncharacterized protein n=1 Tax=Streblomastix strix TaxID=222440 RepID=A0A5J4WRZ3_9EUKA|nr:MAG: hypothetical protein EZS28_007614 [Streblomastix strix]